MGSEHNYKIITYAIAGAILGFALVVYHNLKVTYFKRHEFMHQFVGQFKKQKFVPHKEPDGQKH